jgi:hypothetical protein
MYAVFGFLILFVGLFGGTYLVSAAGQTYTVCASGCDFSSLTDALTSPGLGDDTVTVTSGYVFDPIIETTTPYVPIGVTLRCDPGADTIGDSAEAQISWNIDSNSTIQGCTFDNVRMESSNKLNISIIGNTFTGSDISQVFINASDGFDISDNIGLQELHIGAADNGVIDGNAFECYNNSSCLRIIGYGTVTDFTDSAQISNNVVISNNTITNHEANTYGDWIYIGNGRDISITGNRIQSAVTTANNYVTMISLQSAEVSLEYNTIIMPEKLAPADQSTWGINLRSDAELLDVTANHNTIVFGSQTTTANSQCFGLFDNGGHAQGQTIMSLNYNICYNGTGSTNGTGIGLSYSLSDNNVTVSDSYNGFYNIQNTISDSNGVYTAVDATSVTSNPVFRIENLDTTDDYQVVPMSSYLDVNGTSDIGAYSAARIGVYTIEQGCVVDYVACHSQNTALLNHVIKSGDAITIGAGTYAPIAIPSGLDSITLQGVGNTTVIDATGAAQGLTLSNVTNSIIRNLKIQNANTESFVYNMFSWSMASNGTQYNTISPAALYTYGATCSSNVFLSLPSTDVTNLEGIGTSSVGLYLVHVPDGAGPGIDLDLTVYLPNSIGSTPAEIETNCGQPQSLFQGYVTNAFELQPDNTYVYNATAVANAGISPLGTGDNPFITKVITRDAGLYLDNSSNNQFSDITFSGNNDDVYISSGSGGNSFANTTFTGNDFGIVSDSSATNSIIDSVLDSDSVDINGGGYISVYYTLSIVVTAANDSSAIEGVTGTVKNVTSDNIVQNTLTTDVSGAATDRVLVGTIRPSGVVSYNPITLRISAPGFLSQTVSTSLVAPQMIAISMVAGDDATTTVGGGGSGGFYSTPIVQPLIPGAYINTSVPTQGQNIQNYTRTLSKSPNLRSGVIHRNVKLLQQYLNSVGFEVAQSGPGSPGSETVKFGALTRRALIRFQKAHNIVPASGYFGPLTRQVMSILD